MGIGWGGVEGDGVGGERFVEGGWGRLVEGEGEGVGVGRRHGKVRGKRR